MARFGSYLRRLLYAAFLFSMLLSFPADWKQRIFLLAVSGLSFLAGLFFARLWQGERSLFRERMITGLGIVLASSAAALFAFPPFLFFV